MGYYIAGFDVTGVDLNPQPNYPFTFIQADALTVDLSGYDAIAMSPPCQGYSRLRHRQTATYPMLIAPTRERVIGERPDVPYVIESVEDARPDLKGPVMLCGSSFGLRVRRHRLFETSFDASAPPCDHGWQNTHKPYRLYVGKKRTNGLGYRESGIVQVYGGNHLVGGKSLYHKSVAMGIDWMTEDELNESIPPAYTAYIGRSLMDVIK